MGCILNINAFSITKIVPFSKAKRINGLKRTWISRFREFFLVILEFCYRKEKCQKQEVMRLKNKMWKLFRHHLQRLIKQDRESLTSMLMNGLNSSKDCQMQSLKVTIVSMNLTYTEDMMYDQTKMGCSCSIKVIDWRSLQLKIHEVETWLISSFLRYTCTWIY